MMRIPHPMLASTETVSGGWSRVEKRVMEARSRGVPGTGIRGVYDGRCGEIARRTRTGRRLQIRQEEIGEIKTPGAKCAAIGTRASANTSGSDLTLGLWAR